jgi:hypothetical protein
MYILKCLAVTVALGLTLVSCKKTKTKAPERTSLDSTLAPPISRLTIPLSFSLDKVETLINEKIKGTFLRKRVSVNTSDSLYFELTKQQPIILTWKAPDLRYRAHLKVSGQYMKNILGLKIQNQTPIEFELELLFKTELGFEKDWSIRPRTVIEEIVWKSDPVMDLGIATLNFRKPVEKALNDHQDSLTLKLDGFVKETIDTRKIIEKIWSDLQQPIRLKKDEPRIWLLAKAETLKARWTRGPERQITAQAELTAQISTLVEGDDLTVASVPLPEFSFQTYHQDSLVASVLCTLPFDVVNEYSRKKIVGMRIDSAGYSAQIRNLEVYGTEDGLAVKLGLTGDVRGDVYLQGRPVIDRASKSFRIEDFDFVVDSDDAVLASADWLLHSSIKTMVERQLTYELQPYADMIPMLITSGIEKGKLAEKLEVYIDSWEIMPIATLITSKDLQMIIQVRGMAEIRLQEIRKDSTQQKAISQ